jgi:hypothetical protein
VSINIKQYATPDADGLYKRSRLEKNSFAFSTVLHKARLFLKDEKDCYILMCAYGEYLKYF